MMGFLPRLAGTLAGGVLGTAIGGGGVGRVAGSLLGGVAGSALLGKKKDKEPMTALNDPSKTITTADGPVAKSDYVRYGRGSQSLSV